MKVRGETLKRERKQRGKTLEQLAIETKISKRALSRWENSNESDVNSINAKKLKQFFGNEVDLASLKETKAQPPERPFYADLSGVSRNALFLAARRYDLDQKTIVELAPLLFTIIAENALAFLNQKFHDALDAIEVCKELGENVSGEYVWDAADAINARNVFYRYDGKKCLIWEYLKHIKNNIPDSVVQITDDYDFSICRDDVNHLMGSKNIKEISHILRGWVPISKMPVDVLNGITSDDQLYRVRWVNANIQMNISIE